MKLFNIVRKEREYWKKKIITRFNIQYWIRYEYCLVPLLTGTHGSLSDLDNLLRPAIMTNIIINLYFIFFPQFYNSPRSEWAWPSGRASGARCPRDTRAGWPQSDTLPFPWLSARLSDRYPHWKRAKTSIIRAAKGTLKENRVHYIFWFGLGIE